MKKRGFRPFRCAVKPFLSQQNKEARFRWAQNRVFWSPERFTKIVWSDESRFRLFVNDGRVRVWRERGERFQKDCVRNSCQAGAGSILVWGAIWHDGRSSLQILTKTVNGASYCEILNRFFDENQLPPNFTLQHDNAPAHRSKTVSDFLISRRVSVLDWPSKSPDLNPIEHLWDHMGRRVQDASPRSLPELKRLLLKHWDETPQTYIQTLVSSMKRRISAVLQSHGGNTRY